MNKKVVVRNTDKEAFDLAMKLIAFTEKRYDKEFTCDGYKIIDNELYLSKYSDEAEKFPYEYDETSFNSLTNVDKLLQMKNI